MSNVETIYTNLKSRVGAVLGSDFSEITHTLNLDKNRFDGTSKKFGVLPSSARETTGQTRANTVTQGFEIILTESYISESISDNDLMTKILSLMGKFEDIYKDLINEKAGSPAIVINCSDLQLENALIVSEEKVIIVQASVQITSRVSL